MKLKSGKITVMDGPFGESKEIVGDYGIIDATSRNEALALTRRFMELHLKHWPTFEGECEVRKRGRLLQRVRPVLFAGAHTPNLSVDG